MQQSLKNVFGSPTPQSERPIDKPEMIPNHAGGFAFQVDNWTRLERFLILGSEGGTYYVGQEQLTKENAQCVIACLNEDYERTINTVVDISHRGRAPKNDMALFALAMCASFGSPEAITLALSNLPKVARIGTHLFTFVEFINGMRGWGRQLRRAVGNWYNEKPIDRLVYQTIKYRQRNGWSHVDVLRLGHPKPVNASYDALYKWICKDVIPENDLLEGELSLVRDFIDLNTAGSDKEAIDILNRNDSLTWEMMLSEHRTDKAWEALLPNILLGALIRQLPTLTRLGVIKPMSKTTEYVVQRLSNVEDIKKSRIHPYQVLLALKSYMAGRSPFDSWGDNGRTWNPIDEICYTLEGTLERSFENVDKIDARLYFGIDVSGSMSSCMYSSAPSRSRYDRNRVPVECREGAAVIASQLGRYARASVAKGFSTNLVNFNLMGESFKSVLNQTSNLPYGGTDCSLPMIDAQRNGIEVDAFVVITDNETWAGRVHPYKALQDYRNKMGIPAKLVVIGMTSTDISIADPNDSGMLDIAGFDASIPKLVADFVQPD